MNNSHIKIRQRTGHKPGIVIGFYTSQKERVKLVESRRIDELKRRQAVRAVLYGITHPDDVADLLQEVK